MLPPQVDETLYEVENEQYLGLYKHFFKKAVLDTLTITLYIRERSDIMENQAALAA